MPPLMSFKSFMQTQREDLSPDAFQRLYEQYNLNYLNEFNNAFFAASMAEEWFQDRYNPLNIHRLEKEATDWAILEAGRIKESIKNHAAATVAAMSLEPQSVLQARQLSAKKPDDAEKESGTIFIYFFWRKAFLILYSMSYLKKIIHLFLIKCIYCEIV